MNYQNGIKDLDEMEEKNILPSVITQNMEFWHWIESFYDNDGNYTEAGLSETGKQFLDDFVKRL